MVVVDGIDYQFSCFANVVFRDLVEIVKLLEGKKCFLLGCPCVVVS